MISSWFGKIPNVSWVVQIFIKTRSLICSRQYVKQESITSGPNGREARATRLITERASRRIGTMAFDIALNRPRKVRSFFNSLQSSFPHMHTTALDDYSQIERLVCDRWPLPRNRPRCTHKHRASRQVRRSNYRRAIG